MNGSWKRLRNAGYRSRLYRYALGRNRVESLEYLPQDPWPGDPNKADELFRGRYRFVGREAQAPNQPPWRLRPDDKDWQAALHGFEWLRHFEASGGDAARFQARRLVRSWIDLCGEIDPVRWAPAVLGERLTAWLSHGSMLLQECEAPFQDKFLASLAMQWRHLRRTFTDAEHGQDQIIAHVGLAYGAMAFADQASALQSQLNQLETVVSRQVLSDGGYVSRAPSDLLAVLRRLIALREALEGKGAGTPEWLRETIALMVPHLRGLRHGDGGLALFNGGFEEGQDLVSLTLSKAGVRGRALLSANQSGFQRLTAGRAVILADAGAPPAGIWGRTAHSGGGGFEFSVGRHRLVVNCGSGRFRDGDWQMAARATAAHSTLHLAEDNAWPIAADGTFGANPEKLHCRRREDEFGNTWLELRHEGYRKRYGLTHRRRLYLDATGTDMRGEDRLDGGNSKGDLAKADAVLATLRFHLHPNVQASTLHGGSAVLLRLGDGTGWRFRSSGAEFSLQDSIYLGQRNSARRSTQIVLTTATDPGGTAIKWAFQKV